MVGLRVAVASGRVGCRSDRPAPRGRTAVGGARRGQPRVTALSAVVVRHRRAANRLMVSVVPGNRMVDRAAPAARLAMHPTDHLPVGRSEVQGRADLIAAPRTVAPAPLLE
jgi:hypothetical protein